MKHRSKNVNIYLIGILQREKMEQREEIFPRNNDWELIIKGSWNTSDWKGLYSASYRMNLGAGAVEL